MLQSKSSGISSGSLQGGAVVPHMKILEKVEAQRTEINDLQAKVTSLEAKQTEYEQTLSCVDRQWTQINEDIVYMSSQARSFGHSELPADVLDASSSGNDHPTGNGMVPAAIQDPFLQRLVRKDVITAKKVGQKAKELMKDAPAVEQQLILRAESTKEHLARLFELQEGYQERLTTFLHTAAQSIGQAELMQQVERVTAEAEAARKEAHAQKALARTLQEQQRLLDDEALQQETTIKDLRNELADKEVALQNAQRKLFQARTSSDANAASMSAAAAAAAVKQEPASAPEDSKEAAQGELEAREQLAKRDADLARERAACLKLQREVQELQSRMAAHAQVAQSPLYQAAQQQAADLREQLAAQQRERLDLDLKLADAQHRMHIQDRQLRDADAARELLTDAQQRTAQLQADLMQARQDTQQASLAYQRERARLANTQTVQDLLKLTETLQHEKSRLQSREQKDAADTLKLQQALTELRAAHSMVKEREYELENEHRRLMDKDAQIAAAQRAEDVAIARARDMEVFVQVLLNYSDDPRELSEIRTSEARYRALADSLRSKLEGPEFQAKQDALRQREAKAEERVAALEQENVVLRVQAADSAKRAEELQQQLSACQAESAEYLKEIDSLAMEFDKQQDAIKALVADVSKREEVDSELVTERIRSSQAAAQHRIDQQALVTSATAAEKKAALHAQQAAQLQADLQVKADEAAALQRREIGLAAQLEAARQEVFAGREALRLKQLELDAAQEAAAERKRAAEQEAEELAQERQKRQHAEEDMKAKIAKLATGGPGAQAGSSAQAWELENMRERLYCQVCNSRRQKDRVIKCGHAFCSHCIEAMGKSRQRLCPGCQSKFDHRADVRPLYL